MKVTKEQVDAALKASNEASAKYARVNDQWHRHTVHPKLKRFVGRTFRRKYTTAPGPNPPTYYAYGKIVRVSYRRIGGATCVHYNLIENHLGRVTVATGLSDYAFNGQLKSDFEFISNRKFDVTVARILADAKRMIGASK